MTKSAKRDELKVKIATAKQRQADRGGVSVARAAAQYVHKRPFTALASGVAIGALIGAMLPGKGIGAKPNGAAQKAGKAAIGLGVNILDNAGSLAKQRDKSSSDSRMNLFNEAAIFATREIAELLRKRI